MGSRILSLREARATSNIFGILDGDFRPDWKPLTARPQPWMSSDNQPLGWRWERKEIENYLIDEAVVSRALGPAAPPPDVYQAILEKARDAIGVYQAARTALSASRKRFRDLSSKFGQPRGRERHLFPDHLDQPSCHQGIQEVIQEHRLTQLVTAQEVLDRMALMLPEFQPNGVRHKDYLAAFAGKDLLWSMDADLRGLGFASAWTFREKILVGITQTTDDVGQWLPEWAALQQAVDQA
jgi:hypothetical protein